MTGHGVIQDGIHGAHHIDGLLLDMIDGDMVYTMVGIIMAGVMDGTIIMATTIMDGLIMETTYITLHTGEDLMYIMDVEQLQGMEEHNLL
tara:strand:- start:35680 stop:35949 length:270 start_codon:yes stop_codon:yes gene_type:complete